MHARKHLFALLVAALPFAANADIILAPESVVSNTLGELNSSFVDENLINQNGLRNGYTSGVTDFASYIASNPTHANSSASTGGGWASLNNYVVTGTIIFDLGAEYAVETFALWSDYDSQSVGTFSLDVSNDVAFGSFSSLGSFEGQVDRNAPQLFTLDTASGRYVRWNIVDAVSGRSNLVQAAEIAFEVSAAQVPEPGTLALLGLGLAGFGLARRRRN